MHLVAGSNLLQNAAMAVVRPLISVTRHLMMRVITNRGGRPDSVCADQKR